MSDTPVSSPAPADAVASSASTEPGSIPALDPGILPETTIPAMDPSLRDSFSVRLSSQAGDGSIDVKVADDWMSATATFMPPRDDGRPLSRDTVVEMLHRFGVTSCLLMDVIDNSVMECNLDRHFIRDRIVAEGVIPEEIVPEHVDLEERFVPRERMASSETIKVDFRKLASQPIVKKGEVLGHLVPASAGRAGCDLQGRELVPSRSHKENWAAGAKVLIEDGELRAEVDGLLVRANFQLSVEEVFLVKAGVDYHTGHILFPGDVIIEGKVADGFKVWSGGSILCKTTLDAFDINAKKDLVCQQGIIGRKNGQVKVGGNIAAKFIENCRVACRGDIQVLSAIMGAKVFSLGIIDLGEKGVIMGGETWAVHGLKAARLGNQARQRTLVHVGIDFTVQQRLDQANLRLRQLAFRAQQIDAHVSTHPEVDGAALHRQVDKLVEETRASINDLLVKLDGDDAAIVEVRGEIWPGTIIDICRVEISVDQLLKGCRFRLDKVAGRILVERLAGSEGEKKAAKGAPPAAAKGAPAPANEKAPGKTPASPQTKATSPPAAAVKK